MINVFVVVCMFSRTMCSVFLSALFVSSLICSAVSVGCPGAVFAKEKGRYLPDTVITARKTRSEEECSLLCQREDSCASANYKTSGENKGLCELNDGLLDENNGLAKPEYVHLGIVRRTCEKHLLFSSETKQCVLPSSCKDLRDKNNGLGNGVYFMKGVGGSTDHQVYCHMDEIPGCGVGGWTLVMKLDGTKNTFTYDSPYWSDKNTYQVEEGLKGLTEKETKLQSYWNTPFTKLCVGMRVGGSTKWIEIDYTANSLHSVVADGMYRPTSSGRTAWMSLITGSALQAHCNKEGFNIKSPPGHHIMYLRFGIVANNENNCESCDSFVGFGAVLHGCGINSPSTVTTGNAEACSSHFRSAFAFILAQ